MKTHRQASEDDSRRPDRKRGSAVAAVIGVILGAFLGAVIGAAIALDDSVGGVIGGIIGAIIGGLIGWALRGAGRRESDTRDLLATESMPPAGGRVHPETGEPSRRLRTAEASAYDTDTGSSKSRSILAEISGALLGVFFGVVVGVSIALDYYVGAVIGGVIGAITGWLCGMAIAHAGRRRKTRAPREAAVATREAPGAPMMERAEVADRESRDVSLSRRTDTGVSPATARAADRAERSEVTRIPLVEERLEVDKREFEAGRVRLRKVVKTEMVHLPVELRREEIIVEKVEAGEGESAPAGEAQLSEYQQGEEIVIPLVKEEVVVQKATKVFSEVHIHKVSRTETETIRETLRHEEMVEEQPTNRARGRSEENNQ